VDVHLMQGVHNHSAIAGRISFIFVMQGRCWDQDIFSFFCIAPVLLPRTEPTLLPRVCLDVFLLSIRI